MPLIFLRWLNSESRGTSGNLRARESTKARAMRLRLASLFVATMLIPRSLTDALSNAAFRRIALLSLLSDSTGISLSALDGDILNVFVELRSTIRLVSLSVIDSRPISSLPLNG